eukprot:3121891-Rhodomonas_salina.2
MAFEGHGFEVVIKVCKSSAVLLRLGIPTATVLPIIPGYSSADLGRMILLLLLVLVANRRGGIPCWGRSRVPGYPGICFGTTAGPRVLGYSGIRYLSLIHI